MSSQFKIGSVILALFLGIFFLSQTASAGDLVPRSSGGSGTPASPANSIQYNNAGSFGGDSGLLLTPSATTNLLLKYNNPRFDIYDTGNDSRGTISNTGGELNILNTDGFNAGIFAGFHIQYGGSGANIEYTNTNNAVPASAGGHKFDTNSGLQLYLDPTTKGANVPHVLRVGITGNDGSPANIGDFGDGSVLQVTGNTNISGVATSTVFRASSLVQSSSFPYASSTATTVSGTASTTNLIASNKTTTRFASTTVVSVSGLTSGQCVQTGTGGLLTVTGAACGSGTVTGSGTGNQVAYWSGTSALTGSANLTYDGTTLTRNGNSTFYGGRTIFGSGTTIDLGSDAYMLAAGATGENAGFTASRSDSGQFASFDMLDDANPATGWSLQMANDSTENLYIVDRVSSTNLMTFISPGKVGISTSSPYAALSVVGSTGVVAGKYTATSTTASQFLYASTTSFTSSGSTFFATAGGNVGIATTSPYTALSVVGSTGVVADVYFATSTTATSTFAGNVVIGNSANAFAKNNSLALGFGSSGKTINATGNGSFAFGDVTGIGNGTTTASGNGSLAGGDNSGGGFGILASGPGSIALGQTAGKNINSSGSASFAGGRANTGIITSTGQASFAWGDNIGATANFATAFGTGYTNSAASTFQVGYGATPTLTITATKEGVGTTSPFAVLSVQSNDSTSNIFAVATTTTRNLMRIDTDGHMITGGVAPTCGAGCSAVSGDDRTMRVTTGSGVTSVTVNFSKTYTTTPVCLANEESAGVVVADASSTPTTVVLDLSASLTSKLIAVICQVSDNFTF